MEDGTGPSARPGGSGRGAGVAALGLLGRFREGQATPKPIVALLPLTVPALELAAAELAHGVLGRHFPHQSAEKIPNGHVG